MKKKPNDSIYNGIIVINKPKGYTSHDVVGKTRKILNMRKVGHTGTLDPEATGVLPVCLGKGTKVSDMLVSSDKEYVAEVKLGVKTDTQDIFGTVTDTSDASYITIDHIKEAIAHFTGEIFQIPPMYSAIKINGRKMYDLARQGIEVERKERKITIYSIELLDYKDDVFRIKVNCSKGTYIRTLCHDMGEFLKCGACMQSLNRTKTSVFSIEDAITLDKLEECAIQGNVQSLIMPIDRLFSQYPEFRADEAAEKKLLNGAKVGVRIPEGMYRVYNSKGEFIALGRVENKGLKTEKLFANNI